MTLNMKKLYEYLLYQYLWSGVVQVDAEEKIAIVFFKDKLAFDFVWLMEQK